MNLDSEFGITIRNIVPERLQIFTEGETFNPAKLDRLPPTIMAKASPKVKRPPNSFMLYRAHFQATYNKDNTIPGPLVSKMAAEAWSKESQEIRNDFINQALTLKVEHEQKYPDFQWNKKRKPTPPLDFHQSQKFKCESVITPRDFVNSNRGYSSSPDMHRSISSSPEFSKYYTQIKIPAIPEFFRNRYSPPPEKDDIQTVPVSPEVEFLRKRFLCFSPPATPNYNKLD